MNNFTPRAQQVLALSRKEADRFNHNYIGTEHVLLGLIKLGQGVAVSVLERMGLNLESVRMEVESEVGTGPDGQKVSGSVPYTPRVKKVLTLANKEANALSHAYVGTEHILLGLLREGEGVAARVLQGLNIDIKEAREMILKEIDPNYTPGASTKDNDDDDLDDPFDSDDDGIFGDDDDSSMDSGDGKTPALDAFGTDLTKEAADGEIDPIIGRQEEIERVIQILCRRTKNNPVLIGEAGVGKTAIVEGLAQEIIHGNVPELLRDRKVITLDLALMVAGTKYRGQFEERIKAVMDEMNIEKDAALERRFQQVKVDEPSHDDAIQILKGLQEKYESHHKVSYSNQAIEQSVKLTARYLTDRFLPDKAIDIIDEAGSRARIGTLTRPPQIEELENELAEIHSGKVAAIEEQDFEKAASLRDNERAKKKELDEFLADWQKTSKEEVVEVGEDEIMGVVSKITGVPLARMEEKEAAKLLQMEERLKKSVIGQDTAVTAISKALRRSRADLKDPRRPIGTFLFLGPTGVGKTYLARNLAEFMFGDPESLIQIDMSEYMEKFATSRLIGSPPGYVGYEEGGQLSEAVRRRPYSVVLFDEVEKAHPDVMNLLLQILEEGMVTDSFGRKIDFRNTIIILTSNVGASTIKRQTSLGFGAMQEDQADFDGMKEKILDEAKNHFRPEFLNRLDELVVFHMLEKSSLISIVDLEVSKLAKRLEEKGIQLKLTKTVILERGKSSP